MNTNILNQFEKLNGQKVTNIKGGAYNCTSDFVGGVVTGAGAGAFAGGPAGAFVGAHVGIIGGGLKCVGGKLSDRFF